MDEKPAWWKLTLAGISLVVAILALPFSYFGWYVVITKDEYPLGAMIFGFILGALLIVLFSSAVVIIWRARMWRALFGLSLLLPMMSFGWIAYGRMANYLSRPYEREELVIQEIRPAQVSIAGRWEGSWTNPKGDVTEMITLQLNQNGNTVTGEIITETGRVFSIIDGVVSGYEVNLFYDNGPGEWSLPGGVGSLLGNVGEDGMEGRWYAHERPPPGVSRDGPWNALKASGDIHQETKQPTSDGLP